MPKLEPLAIQPLPSIFYLRSCFACNTTKTLEEGNIDCPGCSPAIIHRDPGDEDDQDDLRILRMRRERIEREERDRSARRADIEQRLAAGLPCGRSVIRHVSARYRNYGPCVRNPGHPGQCSERQ